MVVAAGKLKCGLRAFRAVSGYFNNLFVFVSDHTGVHRRSEELVQRRDAEI